MPPRKRAAAAPKAEADTLTGAGQDDAATQSHGEGAEQQKPDSPPERNGDDQDHPTTESSETDPAKSDLQDTDQPCPECLPNGWPENAYSVGCTHGTWVRNTSN